MRTLLFLALSVSLVACGDDDDRPSTDAGSDSGTVAPDGSTPDGGPGEDTGPGPDSGPSPTMCPAGACDLLTGAGCEAGEACYLIAPSMDAAAVPTCAPAGTATEGMPCEFANSCRDGLVCLADGVCRRACCGGSSATCMPGDFCSGFADAPGAGFCLTPSGCDFVAQTGCEAGQTCTLISGDGSTLCRPAREGGATQNQSCETEPCADGHTCIRRMDESPICARGCDPMAADSCGEGLSCGGLMGAPPTLGVCLPTGG